MRETIGKYIKWLLPVLFISYYSSVSLFTHVHVEHGTTIVHAHPFKKTADGTCHHHASLAEICSRLFMRWTGRSIRFVCISIHHRYPIFPSLRSIRIMSLPLRECDTCGLPRLFDYISRNQYPFVEVGQALSLYRALGVR